MTFHEFKKKSSKAAFDVSFKLIIFFLEGGKQERRRKRGREGRREEGGEACSINSPHPKPFLKIVLKEVPSEPFGVTIKQVTSEEPKL